MLNMSMGYTRGRKHTDESLEKIAKQFNTRSEFQRNDAGAYSSARKRGKNFLDRVCSHMHNISYSIPQMMCKHIMETVTNEKCLYNTRKIIPPYEIDIYFPMQKIAIEYNGKGWHSCDDAMRRDGEKFERCLHENITLIKIEENSRKYEEDVKNQIKDHLSVINDSFGLCINPKDVDGVDCGNVFDEIFSKYDIKSIKVKLKNCKNIADFQRKYLTEYNFLMKCGKLSILDEIREVVHMTNDELIRECRKITSYKDFINNYTNLYNRCRNRGILSEATSHMVKTKLPYTNYDDVCLLDMAMKYHHKSEMYNHNSSLYSELKNRGYDLRNDIEYKTPKLSEHSKEYKIKKCLDECLKYHSYDEMVKLNHQLYKKCKGFKIINDVKALYPSINIEDFLLNESTKFDNFKSFKNSELYKKSLKIKGLTKKIKELNGWNFYSTDKFSHVEAFPEIVDMINSGIKQSEISKISGVNVTTIWRVKKAMKKIGILKVGDKFRID